ncbi:MAG: nuclease [Deltaproteobacteria bacterium]|nr:nuclease [Deltaproteobacteria bacterium]
MDQHDLEKILDETFADRRVSHDEKQTLIDFFADVDQDYEKRAFIRNRVFALCRDHIQNEDAQVILKWALDMMKALDKPLAKDITRTPNIAKFSPGTDCLHKIQNLLRRSRKKVEICVFTITDDRISNEILRCHERGVHLRIITDDDKSEDLGSDIHRLVQKGVPVCMDQTSNHMHHKFALFDDHTLLTGSYNWTRSAASVNWENILVTGDEQLIRDYGGEFEKLWRQWLPHRLQRR